MNHSDLKKLQNLIIQAAREELLPRFTKVSRAHKPDGSIITEADLAMQRRIEAELLALYPDIAFVGEEMSEAEQDAIMADHSRPIWILDPLDGTSNFAAGLPNFAPSLALLKEGEIILGIVYDPMRDECFSALKGQGAWLNGQPLGQHRPEPPLSKGIGLVDYKRLSPELATRLAIAQPFSSQRSIGSVALDWCWVAAGRCHVYLHGKQRLWDYGAGYLILAEAGGHSCSLDGEPVFQAHLKPRSAIASLDLELFNEWVEWIGIHRS